MSTINERINTLDLKVDSNLALINGGRKPGYLYAFYGDKVRYGCYVTNSDTETIVFDDSESESENPNALATPLRIEEYENMALVYGEVFALSNANATDIVLDSAEFPSSGFSRYDIIYIYVGSNGPTIDRAEGASLATPVDPTIPRGSMSVARVTVDDTGITAVTDLRNVTSAEGGVTGSFESLDGKTITVVSGIITSIDTTTPDGSNLFYVI